MKRQIFTLLWACYALGYAQAQQAVGTETATNELERVLETLNRPAAKDSDIEHPGWKDPALLARLRSIAGSATNLPPSWTAQLWLAVIEFDDIQRETRRPEIRRKVDAFNVKLDNIIASAGDGWQAKAARISKCASLFFARRWDDCRTELDYILKNIAAFRSETNPGFIQYAQVQGKALEVLEPEMRFIRLMIEAMEGNYQGAIEVARQIKSSFPQWSQRHRLDGTIELLKAGKCPFHIP
jgi:hypothetical protein